MSTQESSATRDASPWWNDPRAARLLHRAASEGAVIVNETTYLAGFPDEAPTDEWFLDVNYGTFGYAHVRYTTELGYWALEVDTSHGALGRIEATVDDHMAASVAIGRAANLCRDLNRLVKRDQNMFATISDEVAREMDAWGMEPQDMAAKLGVTHGVLMSKLSGSTSWSTVDIARLHRTFGPELTDRIFEAVH